MLTILIVDDEYLVRLGIRETINWHEYGFEIIGEACDGEEGLELALKHQPDIIITDIRMPFMDGLEFMEKIRENGLKSSIIVLSGYDEFDYVRSALNNEASSYLLKPIENDKLIETVKKVGEKIKKEKSTGHYFEKLKNELSVVKKQFLRELLTGNISDLDEIKSKISFLNIPLEVSNNHIIVIKIDEYSLIVTQICTDDLKNLQSSIVQLIAEKLLLNSNFMGIVVETKVDEWVVIAHPYNDECTVETIKNYCYELTDKLKEEHKQSISIGISDLCNDIVRINQAYKEASLASENKLLPGFSSVSYIGESDTSNCRREIKQAIQYIKNNYSRDDITVELVAKDLFLSPYYLMHLFKSELGKTFVECLIEYRIDVAKKLLRDTNYKIYEVSNAVGYGDTKYFSQLFKKVTGMTPSEYVRKDNSN